MAYPEVNSQYPIREIQIERPLAKCLDCWIKFETYLLFKNGFAKALQAPSQLQAVRLNNARAGRPCARNSILESCGFVHDLSGLSLLPRLQSYELTDFLSDATSWHNCVLGRAGKFVIFRLRSREKQTLKAVTQLLSSTENMIVAFLHSDIGILLINKLNFAFHFALSSYKVTLGLSLLGKVMAG